ncbi:hypothetical protein M9434_004192 [Picochlorum sp. BPE23]|nr:hypothetical protein M9434_004192 [Picochlorum sp. BPE23]
MYTCSMRPIGASKGVKGIHVHNLRGARCVGRHHGRLFVRRDCIRDVVCQAKGTKRDKKPVVEQFRPPSKAQASLRAEAEAPFRSFRIVLFGFGGVSAVLATLFSIPTLIGALAGAPNAKSLTDAFQDILINVAALGVCGYLLRGDLQAREKQMARLMREDQLGMCQVELSNSKMLRLGQLRGSARPVIIVGTKNQVAGALQQAEKFREALEERGVLIIAIPMYESSSQGSEEEEQGLDIPELTDKDLRWRAKPVRVQEWKSWFDEQAAASGKSADQGLYVGLRLDGRVRASGRGCPPWDAFAAQLPPTDGFFGEFLDGMDGVV